MRETYPNFNLYNLQMKKRYYVVFKKQKKKNDDKPAQLISTLPILFILEENRTRLSFSKDMKQNKLKIILSENVSNL